MEYSRHLSNGAGGGGHVFTLPVAGSAPRGTWRLDLYGDPDALALASTTLLVEDFLPERIDFDLALSDPAPHLGARPTLTVDARYLFGAPGADLAVEGNVRVKPVRSLDGWPGYLFGPHEDLPGTEWGTIASARTDASGHAETRVTFPKMEAAGLPLEASFTVEVREGSGRPVERSLTAPVTSEGPMIGIKPGFDATLPEGSEARFEVIALGADGFLKTSSRKSVQFSQTQTVIDNLQIITSSGEVFNHVDDHLPMWVDDGDRTVRVGVTFSKPFKTPPNITIGLSGIDTCCDHNLR